MNLTVNRLLNRYSKWFNEKKNEVSNEDGYCRLIAIERFEINKDGADLHFIAEWIPTSGNSIPTKLIVTLGNLNIEESTIRSDQYLSHCNWKIMNPSF